MRDRIRHGPDRGIPGDWIDWIDGIDWIEGIDGIDGIDGIETLPFADGASYTVAVRFLLLPLLVSVGATSACGPARDARSAMDLGAVPAGFARVCVVRPESTAAHVTMTVRDNGRLVGATRGAAFFCYLAAPGTHQIASDADDTGPTLLRAAAGARYFLHQEVVDFAGAAHAHLDWVDETRAGELIEACETRVFVSVPGHDDETRALPIAPAKPM